MISRTDVLLLLTDLQNQGVDVSQDITKLYSSQYIPLDILKKINNMKPLDLVKFYEKIRSSYNHSKSKLYINIMKSNENAVTDVSTVLTTLTALLNQILQFKCNDKPTFYKNVRCDEITKVLDIYFKTFNLDPALKLLNLFKADIVALECVSGHRNNGEDR